MSAVLVLTLLLLDKTAIHDKVSFPVNEQAEAQVESKQNTQAASTQVEVQPAELISQTPKEEPPTHLKGCANYAHILGRYDWNKKVMADICQAESHGNPHAIGDTRVIGGIYAPSCGLFQIRTLAGRPSCEQLQNPEINIAWAHKIYVGQGYKAWSVCSGKVSCY